MGTSQDMLKLIPALIVCMLTEGCVGIAVFGTKTQTLDPPAIRTPAQFDSVWEYGSTKNIPKITGDSLRVKWGEPASVELSSTTSPDELWTYKFGHFWCGIVLSPVVTVPLLLPVGRHKVVFFLREGQVIKAEVVKSGSAGSVFFLVTAEGPCKSMVWNDYEKQSPIVKPAEPAVPIKPPDEAQLHLFHSKF
jgi:hypothetical protein